MTPRTAKRATPGDYIEIPLGDGRFGYAQYIHDDRRDGQGYGALVQVLDVISNERVDPVELDGRGALFPPVFVGVAVPVKTGRWKVVGHAVAPPRRRFRFRKTSGTKP